MAVSYALDLFGANRRLIEGLNAQVDYQNWQLQGARLMLAGNVVSAAIRQAQLRSQIDLTRQMLALQQQQLGITEQRVQAGGLASYNISQQRTLVEQTRATIPPLEQQLDVVNHQLAVLIGKSPAEAHIEPITLDQLHLPEELPVSLPSSLVRQRPDIRAAESLMHQASANVGVATANLYPQITLSASVGAIGTSFTDGGNVWSFGGALAQPIFNGGALRAEKRKAVAAYEEAGANYQQVVLQAFEQVADSLRAIDHDAQTLQARTEAAAQAEAHLSTSPPSATPPEASASSRCSTLSVSTCKLRSTGPPRPPAATPTLLLYSKPSGADGGIKRPGRNRPPLQQPQHPNRRRGCADQYDTQGT